MDDGFTRISGEDGREHVFADTGEGPLVVFLHGFPDTPHGWDGIAAAVAAAGFRAVRPWLRGYHPATIVPGRPYDALTIAADPLSLLDALGERQAVIVGHDWGSVIAYGAASLAPERVRAIVPVALPHPTLLPQNLATLWTARHFIVHKLPIAERLARRNDFAYIDGLYRRWAPSWHGPAREQCLAHVRACFADPRSLSGALDYYRALSMKVPAELVKVPDVRGLVVGGGGEHVLDGTFEETAKQLGAGSSALVVPGAGHWPHREGEAQFTQALVDFLGDLDPVAS
ncbi:epoxide hydrolase [Patulibacter medicamentivorans]|uniref:Epoxide hydrolase n=1 Tax=Patulibacter medicamentivorans TaxID=1097667 RepID=H0E456_9ACTN|nr:alpha/beta hydrolase [Patulibacter medicamentivorans]EHN11545.1 epoxide hydrolase [Patulibacter medicamentivorans]